MTHRTLAGSVALAALALGTAWLAAPARAGDPVKDLVNKVQFYIPEHKQVMIGQLSKLTNSQAPLQLLQGIGRLDALYRVSQTSDGANGEGGLPLLSLSLRDGGPDHPRMVVEVDPGTHFLRRIELHDMNGNVSTFTFRSVRAD